MTFELLNPLPTKVMAIASVQLDAYDTGWWLVACVFEGGYREYRVAGPFPDGKTSQVARLELLEYIELNKRLLR